MKKEDVEIVISDINAEGFDYAFVHYDDYKSIRSPEFHKVRKAFLKARKTLAQFLSKKAEKYKLDCELTDFNLD